MAWRVMAYAHELAREHAAQLAAAQRAVELTPSNADNLFALAMAQLSSGHTQAALATIEDVLAVYPLPPAWVPAVHAGILWANGQLEATLRSAEQCLSSAPHIYRARVHRIAALVELGRTCEARDEAVLLQQQLPWITAEHLLRRYADSAVSLR